MGGAPRTVKWRGIDTDPESAHCWETAAVDPDLDDILVRPIPGYGSYRANAASAGTDSGGGHVDINLEGLTDEQCRRIETVFRRYGNAAWWRPRINPATKKPYGWQNHLHVLRIDCADLAGPARTQVADYLAGWSGLPIGGRVLRDSGSRAHITARWAAVKRALTASTTKPTPPKEASSMTLSSDDLKRIWMSGPVDIIEPPNPTKDNPTWAPASILKWTIRYALNAANDAAAARRDAAATLALVKALAAKPGGLSAAEIETAAKAGAAAALDERIRDADVTLNVTP